MGHLRLVQERLALGAGGSGSVSRGVASSFDTFFGNAASVSGSLGAANASVGYTPGEGVSASLGAGLGVRFTAQSSYTFTLGSPTAANCPQ